MTVKIRAAPIKLPFDTEITGDMVLRGMKAAGITRVFHNECRKCHYQCGYVRSGNKVFFDAGCRCDIYTPMIRRPVEWVEVAEWINIQDVERWRRVIASRCGIELIKEEESEEAAEEPAKVETAWGMPVPG